MSMPIRLLFAAMLLLCLFNSAVGQTTYGCYITPVGGAPQTRIYFTREAGSQTNPVRFYNSTDFMAVDCPSGASTSNTHAVNLGDYNGTMTGCWAQRKAGAASAPNPNPNNAGEYDYNGRLVTYRIEQCPIDDYVSFMFFGIAMIGFFIIKRDFNFF